MRAIYADLQSIEVKVMADKSPSLSGLNEVRATLLKVAEQFSSINSLFVLIVEYKKLCCKRKVVLQTKLCCKQMLY